MGATAAVGGPAGLMAIGRILAVGVALAFSGRTIWVGGPAGTVAVVMAVVAGPESKH